MPEIIIAVRVKPGSSRTRVGGSYQGAQRLRSGTHQPASALVVAVTARAVDGKATEAVRQALAEALGVRPAAVRLRAGASSRDKLFAVTGAGVAERFRDLIAAP